MLRSKHTECITMYPAQRARFTMQTSRCSRCSVHVVTGNKNRRPSTTPLTEDL